MLAVSAAEAGTVVQCGGANTCFVPFSLIVSSTDGTLLGQGGGQLMYDSASGDISLDLSTISGEGGMATGNALVWSLPDGETTVSVTDLFGNADPSLGFAVAATTGATGITAAFAFNLPIALSGQIRAASGVSYSLTSTTPAGAGVTPTFGNTKIVRAFEVDTDVPPAKAPDLNKGVDVGDEFSIAGAPLGSMNSPSPPYSTVNFFTGNVDYDLMAVLVAFQLTARSSVGISGFVDQFMVPLPATLPLLLSAIAGLGGMLTRRRQSSMIAG